jgi:hypothetical protein
MNKIGFLILALSVIIVGISVWESDWNWLIVAVIGIVVVLAPIRVTGNRDASYDRHLLGIATIPLVTFILLFMVGKLVEVQQYYPISIAIHAFASMAFGMLIAVFMNVRTEISLSRRWTIVFALTFACTLSVLYMFFTVFWMSSTGYPFFNGDFSNTMENDDANRMLMIPMAVTALSTILYAIIISRYLKRVDSLELSKFTVGDSS